jgi:LuxR family maltose regulon positive regulatory protein
MKQRQGIISKITPPRLPSVFDRNRLFNRIDKSREHSATWISGAPGSGKTTLVASYIKACRDACVWYQMDKADDDPANFFHYMTLATSKVSKDKSRSLPKLAPEYFQDLSNYAVQYFRELFNQLRKPLIIVLDNYQEVPTDSILHELINTGLEQVPYGLNVFILSRTAPPPVMARLLVNKVMVMIQPVELSLTEEESVGIAALADKWKPCLESITRIYNFTGGWTAGLVLMLEYSRPGEEIPSSFEKIKTDYFFNYFAGEIFNQLEPAVRKFLLQISCMPSFTPEAAKKITGFKKASRVLADLNRKNYFTYRKIQNGVSYQFHPLFREFLVSKAEELLDSHVLCELFKRVADTLAERGQLEDAYDLYVKSNDRKAQETFIRTHAASLLSQGRMRIVEHWIEKLPQNIFNANPWLLYTYGQCRLPFDIKDSRDAFVKAYQQLKEKDDYPALILTISAVIETIVTEWGNFKQLDPWIEALNKLLKEHKNLISTEIQAKAESALFTAFMFRKPDHPDMERLEKRMIQLHRSDADPQLRIIAGTYLLHFTCWRGDMFQARMIVAITRELMKTTELSPLVFMTAKMCEAIFGWFTGDFEGCMKDVKKGLEAAEKSGVHIIDNWIRAQEVYARLTLGDPTLAKPVLGRMKPILNSSRLLDISHYHYLQSVYYLQAGNTDFALRNCKEAIRISEITGSPFPEALNCITASQIYYERGNIEKANEFNVRARTIAYGMNSYLLEMLSLFNEAYFNLKAGQYDHGTESLKAALTIRKERDLINFPCWRRELMHYLYEEALKAGIEVEYVHNLINKRELRPRQSSVEIENWPWKVKVFTLGRFKLVVDEAPLVFKGKPQSKPLELLKALISLGGRDVGLFRLETLLWPDAEGDKARNSLITTLHRLRKLIGHEKAVELSGSLLSLNDRCCWLDVWSFEKYCIKAEAVAEKSIHDVNAIPRMADKLMRLYGGDFLKDDDNLSWVRPLRIKLRCKFKNTFTRLAREMVDQYEYEDAIDLYLRGLEVDEVAEELYQGLMACYKKMGRTADCLSIYERCRKTLSAVLGTEPSKETLSIRQSVSRSA